MYLAEKSNLPSFSPFRALKKRYAVPNNLDIISRSFDENILRRLKALKSSSSPLSISLSWISLAVDCLSSSHAEAQTLISKLTSSNGSSDGSLALYIDHSVKVLDICNSITSEIEKLRQRRLRIKFVLHLLEFPGKDRQISAPEKLRRVTDSISDIEKTSNRGSFLDPEVLIRELAAAIESVPRGKVTSAGKVIRRTIHATGLVTVLIAGVIVSALYGSPEIAKIRVPTEFLWADSFNDLESAIFGGERKALLDEIDDVATSVSGLRDAIDGVVIGGSECDGVSKERLKSAVKKLETVTEKFSENLDRLANGVNGLFRTVLSTRNGALENFRAGHEKTIVNL